MNKEKLTNLMFDRLTKLGIVRTKELSELMADTAMQYFEQPNVGPSPIEKTPKVMALIRAATLVFHDWPSNEGRVKLGNALYNLDANTLLSSVDSKDAFSSIDTAREDTHSLDAFKYGIKENSARSFTEKSERPEWTKVYLCRGARYMEEGTGLIKYAIQDGNGFYFWKKEVHDEDEVNYAKQQNRPTAEDVRVIALAKLRTDSERQLENINAGIEKAANNGDSTYCWYDSMRPETMSALESRGFTVSAHNDRMEQLYCISWEYKDKII